MIILLFGTRRFTSGLLRDPTLMAFALHYRKVLSTLFFHNGINVLILGWKSKHFDSLKEPVNSWHRYTRSHRHRHRRFTLCFGCNILVVMTC